MKFNWAKGREKEKLYEDRSLEIDEKRMEGELVRASKENGPATPAQCAKLREFGVDTRTVKFKDAQHAIGYLSSRGWGRLPIDEEFLYLIAHGEVYFSSPPGTQQAYEAQRPHFVVPIRSARGTCLLPEVEARPHGESYKCQPDEPAQTVAHTPGSETGTSASERSEEHARLK